MTGLPVLTGPGDRAWMAYANCRGVDPELFHPGLGANDDVAAAKAVCRGCVVRDACLNYAIALHEEQGVWGGETRDARLRIARERRRAARSAA